MDRFFADAAKGTLPALTWIDPRQGINKTLGDLGGPNSDHPSCCDVALGERLRKDIYEALRVLPVHKSNSESGAPRHRRPRWRGGHDSARDAPRQFDLCTGGRAPAGTTRPSS